jgi:hypothetical protein
MTELFYQKSMWQKVVGVIRWLTRNWLRGVDLADHDNKNINDQQSRYVLSMHDS